MQLKNFYLHAVYGNDKHPFNKEKVFSNLEKILQSGYILSRRRMNDESNENIGWNGLDYISICDYSKRNNPPYENRDYFRGYTAYNLFIKNSISFIIKKDKVEAIKPILMPPAIYDWNSSQKMRALGNHPTKRYSDLPDELQVKDQISLDSTIGITIPLAHLHNEQEERNIFEEETIKIYEDAKSLLSRYDRNIPIYDLTTEIELDSSQKVKMILKNNK